jgi:GTP-dependent phosphoenolpyruvate carboxykinase
MTSSAAELRMPHDWRSEASWTAQGNSYEFGVDPSMDEPGRHSLLVQSVGSRNGMDIGGVTQILPGYAGKRVRLTAQVKTSNSDTWAGLVLGDKPMFLPQLSRGDAYTMAHFFGAAAGADWQTVSVVVDVPSDDNVIMPGLALVGNGKVWARDMKLDVVGKDVPVSTSKIGFDIAGAQAREQEQEAALAAHEQPPQNLELQ